MTCERETVSRKKRKSSLRKTPEDIHEMKRGSRQTSRRVEKSCETLIRSIKILKRESQENETMAVKQKN